MEQIRDTSTNTNGATVAASETALRVWQRPEFTEAVLAEFTATGGGGGTDGDTC